MGSAQYACQVLHGNLSIGAGQERGSDVTQEENQRQNLKFMHNCKPYDAMSRATRVSGTSQRRAICFLIVCTVWTSWTSGSNKALQEDLSYRKDRAAWMRSERSPLALAGLLWLKAGPNNLP